MIAALADAIAALVAGIVEAIAGFFFAGAEALSLLEILALLVIALVELLFWGFRFVVELFVALFHRRRPRKVPKPVIWRPRKLSESSHTSTASQD